jgi:hypothetical protein
MFYNKIETGLKLGPSWSQIVSYVSIPRPHEIYGYFNKLVNKVYGENEVKHLSGQQNSNCLDDKSEF